mgnify:CR=1 FL=1
MLHPFPDDVIDNPVFLPLIRRHDVVALGVVERPSKVRPPPALVGVGGGRDYVALAVVPTRQISRAVDEDGLGRRGRGVDDRIEQLTVTNRCDRAAGCPGGRPGSCCQTDWPWRWVACSAASIRVPWPHGR